MACVRWRQIRNSSWIWLRISGGALAVSNCWRLSTQYADGSSYIDVLMRRICLRALVKKLGSGVTIRRNVSVIHPETFEIGDRVFIGEQTIMQGRFDGRCVIGDRSLDWPTELFRRS